MTAPLEPTREQARQWAIQELSHREYQDAQPGLLSRIMDWIGDLFSNWTTPSSPGAGAGAAIVLAIVLVVVIWAVFRAGGLRRNARVAAAPAFSESTMSAAEHAAAADRHAAAGDWNLAVIERFRAIVRELEERTIIDGQRGRTADEIAVAAAAAVPTMARSFVDAARIFDDVRYGDVAATATQDGALRELSGQLRRVRVADLPGRTSANDPADSVLVAPR